MSVDPVIPGAIRIDCFLIAEGASAINNLLYVIGGGIDHVGFTSFPGIHSVKVAARLVVPFTETNRVLHLAVTVEDEDGRDILPTPMRPQATIGRPATLTRGEEQTAAFVLHFHNISFPQPGVYTFVARLEERVLARAKLTASLLPPGFQP